MQYLVEHWLLVPKQLDIHKGGVPWRNLWTEPIVDGAIHAGVVRTQIDHRKSCVNCWNKKSYTQLPAGSESHDFQARITELRRLVVYRQWLRGSHCRSRRTRFPKCSTHNHNFS